MLEKRVLTNEDRAMVRQDRNRWGLDLDRLVDVLDKLSHYLFLLELYLIARRYTEKVVCGLSWHLNSINKISRMWWRRRSYGLNMLLLLTNNHIFLELKNLFLWRRLEVKE